MIAGVFRKSSDFLSSLYDDFKEFLSPSFCPGCGGDDLDRSVYPLCERCHKLLVESNSGGGPVCPFCGRPEGIRKRCELCEGDDSIRLFFWGPYDDLLKDCIASFKFDGFPELGRPLIDMALKSLSERLGDYDMIVPVPLYRQRKEERGYNQSELLAERLSQIVGVDFAPGILERVKPTKQQAKLSMEERRVNVRDAFATGPGRDRLLKGRKILLVDDIVTTGATISEAARPLRSGGAERVDVFALAYAK
jgi:competence protein ComFC